MQVVSSSLNNKASSNSKLPATKINKKRKKIKTMMKMKTFLKEIKSNISYCL